jgi:hypothetical protein
MVKSPFNLYINRVKIIIETLKLAEFSRHVSIDGVRSRCNKTVFGVVIYKNLGSLIITLLAMN